MKLALFYFVLSIALPLLLTASIYFFFWHDPPTNAYAIPRTCVPITLQENSRETTSLVCYSCFKRDLVSDIGKDSIKVSSNGQFNYIGFEEDTREYSCDELLQMVDSKSYINNQMFKLQDLETIYQTMIALKGKANKTPVQSALFPRSTKSVFLLQRIAIIQPESYPQSLARTKFTLNNITSFNQQILALLLPSMCVISCSMHLLLMLFRQYKDMHFQADQLLKILIPIVSFVTAWQHPQEPWTFVVNNKYIEGLFLLTTLTRNNQYRYFLPCLLFIFLVADNFWLLGSQWCFFLIYLHSIFQSRFPSNEYKQMYYQFFTLLLFIVNKSLTIVQLSDKQIAIRIILYWVIILFSQNIESVINILYNGEGLKLASDKSQHNDFGQEELSSLRKSKE